MGQIKHYNNGKWTIYTSGEGLSGYTGVTDTYYVGPDLNNDGNLTKANPDGSLVNLEKPTYKVYTALLTQTGSSAPDTTVLENTLGSITYTYLSNGDFTINSAGLFTDENKIFVLTGPSTQTPQLVPVIYWMGSNTLKLQYYNNGVLANDGDMYNLPIEIRVYN